MRLHYFLYICVWLLLIQTALLAQKPQEQGERRSAAQKPPASVPGTELNTSSDSTQPSQSFAQQAAQKTFAQLNDDVLSTDQPIRLAAIRTLSRHFSLENQEKAETLLLGVMQDPSWMIRGEAVFTLSFGASNSKVISTLMQALKDEHWFVRARAAQALGRLKATASVPELVTLFPQESWDNQARIAYALGEISDPQGIETLLTALSSDDESLQIIAYQGLKNFKDDRVRQALLARFAVEKSSAGKFFLTRAVGVLGIKESQEQLRTWHGENPELDREIALALYRMGESSELDTILHDFGQYPKTIQLEILADFQRRGESRAVSLLIHLLEQGTPQQRPLAATALESIRENLPLASLLEALTDSDTITRETLIRILKKSQDGRLPDLIIKRLKVEPPRLEREALISILESFKTPPTIATLLAARLDEKQKPRLAILQTLEHFNITLEALSARAANPELPTEQRIEATLWLGQLGEPTAISKLAQLMTTPDSKQRLAAVEALGKADDRTAIEPLIVSLDDSDATVRAAAKRALERFGLTAERLANDLKSQDWQIRLEALYLMSRLGTRGQTMTVLPLLRDPEGQVRRIAAQVLGALKDARAVDGLLSALRDTEMSVRMVAAAALGEIGDTRATPGLLAALRSSTDAAVSFEVTNALVKLKSTQTVPVLMDMLHSPNWTARAQVARFLGEFHDPRAVPPLTSALEDPSAVVRYYAQRSLVQIGGASPAELVKLLTKPETRARFGAMEVIQQSKLTTSVELLLDRLQDDRPAIRAMAAYTLGNLRDARAADRLLERLESEDRFSVRWWLAYALGQLGDPVRETLIKLTEKKLARVRADALRALGFMSPTFESRAALVEALQDKDEQVRSSAIEALGRSQDTTVIPQLIALLEVNPGKTNPREKVRPDAVVGALFHLGEKGKNALTTLAARTDAGLKSLIFHTLGENGDPALFPVLSQALHDSSTRVRITALQELARQSDEKALGLIVGMLTDGTADVRLEVVRLLGVLGDSQAVEGLKSQLKRETSPEVRTEIEQTLRKLADLKSGR